MKANAEGTYTWGEWKLLVSEELLEHKKGYRVDFKRMGTAAGMLDIIFQVERQQLSPEAVCQLVTALADIFDPQGSLCCDGAEHPFHAEERFRERLATGFTRSRRAGTGNLWFGEADRPAGTPN